MIPRQSPPVTRPFLFPTALQLVTEPSVSDPTKKRWKVVTGAATEPNYSQRFLYPLSCYQDCSILSAFSFAQCMLGCRW